MASGRHQQALDTKASGTQQLFTEHLPPSPPPPALSPLGHRLQGSLNGTSGKWTLSAEGEAAASDKPITRPPQVPRRVCPRTLHFFTLCLHLAASNYVLRGLVLGISR